MKISQEISWLIDGCLENWHDRSETKTNQVLKKLGASIELASQAVMKGVRSRSRHMGS